MRKNISKAVAATLVLSAIAPVASAFADTQSFSDTASLSTEAQASIADLVAKGIINGTDSTHFAPNETLTRAQFAKIVVLALGIKVDTSVTKSKYFTDVTGWAAPYVDAAKDAGFVAGTSATTFDPNGVVTREQAAKFMVLALGYQADANPDLSHFSDAASIDSWAAGYVTKAVSLGLYKGNSDGTFAPKADAPRWQAALLAERFLSTPKATDTAVVSVSAVDNGNGTATVSGTAQNADSVQVSVDGGAAQTATVNNGAFTLTTGSLTAGSHTVSVVAVKGTTTSAAKTATVNVVISAIAVKNVTVLNAKQVQVTFNGPVDASSAMTTTNYTLGVGGAHPSRVTLDSTNTVATLTFAAGFVSELSTYQEFDVNGVYASGLATEVQDYQTSVFVNDATVPTATTAYTAPNVVVSFSEPLKADSDAAPTKLGSTATVSVDGVVTTSYTVTSDNTYSDALSGVSSITFAALSAGTHTIDIVGAKDLAGNVLPAYHTTVNVVADTTAPVVNSIVADGSKVKITLSKPVVDATLNSHASKRVWLTINGNDYYADSTNEVDTNGQVYEVDATPEISGTFANVSVQVKDAVDASGNHVAASSAQTVRVTKDTTAPSVSGNAFVSGKKIIIPFNEAIQAGSSPMTTADITVVTSDGLHVEKTTEALGTVAYAYDANNNGVTTDPGENHYLVLPVTGTDFDNAAGTGLKSGTYTIKLTAGAVEDQAVTPNVTTTDTTVSFTVSSASASTNNLAFTPSQVAGTPGQLSFAFSAPVTSSALSASNYTIDGQALPAGTQLYFNGDYQHVIAQLPAGYITATGYRTIAAKNVVDTNGNTLNTAAGTGTSVDVLENVAPVASSASLSTDKVIKVQFNKVITAPTTGVQVWVNGTQVATSDVAFGLAADANGKNTILTLTTTTFSFDPSQSIVVKFVSGNDLKDTDGNVVAAGQVNVQ